MRDETAGSAALHAPFSRRGKVLFACHRKKKLKKIRSAASSPPTRRPRPPHPLRLLYGPSPSSYQLRQDCVPYPYFSCTFTDL